MEFDSVSPRIIADLGGNSGLCSRSNGVVPSASDALFWMLAGASDFLLSE